MKVLLVVAITVATITLVTGHTGTCASIGYSDRCCPPGANCQASDGNCKCSADCHLYEDCCSDVSCPRSNKIDAIVPLLYIPLRMPMKLMIAISFKFIIMTFFAMNDCIVSAMCKNVN